MPTPINNQNTPKLRPSDIGTEKLKSRFTYVNGHRWHYLDAPSPSPQQKGTIILLHGFPDTSFAWRYQIPLFTALGFRCLALDCMGYGHTGSSSSLRDYTFKTHADAILEIAKTEGIRGKIVLGGHDWGGFAVYRVAAWVPGLVGWVFSVATAYAGVSGRFVGTRELVQGLPQLGYQVQFGSEERVLEGVVGRDEGRLRRFLLGMFGGRTGSGRVFMTPERGVDLGVLEEEVGMTPLLDEEELRYYVGEFVRNGLEGPCNWYRTRRLNWEDDQNLSEEGRRGLKQPTLYVLAAKDNILTREMSRGMEKAIPNLTRAEVQAGHWALWQTPEETNAILKDWLQGVVLGGRSKL